MICCKNIANILSNLQRNKTKKYFHNFDDNIIPNKARYTCYPNATKLIKACPTTYFLFFPVIFLLSWFLFMGSVGIWLFSV